MANYKAIYDKMEPGAWYTAAELHVAPASMTAMFKRGLVRKRSTSPMRYSRIEASKMMSIIDFVKQDNTEFFTLYRKDRKLGMLCSIKNNAVVDCWGKMYDLADVNRMCVYHEGKVTEHILED